MAPAMIVNVHSGKTAALTRYENLSSEAEAGSRSMTEVANLPGRPPPASLLS